MFFNSAMFLIFYPIVLLMYFVLPKRIKNIWLLIASYYFYMCWNAKYGLLLFFCTVVTYLASLIIENLKKRKTGGRKTALILALCTIFSILAYYKYANFICNNIVAFLKVIGIKIVIPEFSIILPVGISFFTFQAAGYLIDVYRGDIYAETNFLKYALFVSFFPQLVAGPIERSKNLLKQLGKTYEFDFDRARDGFLIMLWGYFMKVVIADRAAIFVDNVYNNWTEMSGAAISLATILFAFQIYCDFGGYSYIALGAAKILGIDLMVNFKSPYFSESIKEFWNNWHISLNTWFRDYIYFPLGGSRKGKIRKYINLMIVFFISGLWHGARWNYVAWGLLNGCFRIIGDNTYSIRNRILQTFSIKQASFSHKLCKTVITFSEVTFAWLFFRANRFLYAIGMIKKIIGDFRPETILASAQYGYGLDERNFKFLIISIIFLMVIDGLGKKGIKPREWLVQQDWWFRVVVIVSFILLILVRGVWGNEYNAQGFIYFQF